MIKIADDIPRPNGIILSPDEKTLYVANTLGAYVIAFDVQPDGSVRNERNFARLAGNAMTNRGVRSTKKDIPNYGFLSAGSFATGSFDSVHQVDNLTPNDEINRSDRTWEWNGKMMGASVFPAEVQLSANYEHRSGDVFARQVRFTGGQTIPSIVLNVEPIGTQRTPNLNLLTFRVEKAFRILTTQKIEARLNVYNALNASTATVVEARAGSSFLRPRNILPPRIFELSATYDF